MSHVITSKAAILNLDALAVACERRGLELVPNQETFRWYGHSIGDYPLPDGFTEEDMGHCVHAIRIPGEPEQHGHKPYEIGLVEAREPDGHGGFQTVEGKFTLMYDFWSGGYGMKDKAGGEQCQGLVQEYVCAVAEETLGEHWIQDREVLKDGTMVLTLTV